MIVVFVAGASKFVHLLWKKVVCCGILGFCPQLFALVEIKFNNVFCVASLVSGNGRCSVPVSGSSGSVSSLGWGHCVVFLSKTL